MALSFKSNEFRETRNTLEELSRQGKLTPDVAREIVTSKGINPKEFKEANRKFKAFKEQPHIKKLIERGIDPTEPTIVDQFFLAPTRAVGQFVEGALNLGDAAARASLEKDTYDSIKNTIDGITPERAKEMASAFTDPYHGEGIAGAASEITGDIGSYIIGAGGAIKLGNLALQSNRVAPQVARLTNKMGRKSKLATKGGALGLAGAIGTTIVENPKENSVDYIYATLSKDPDALKKLEDYARNPTDPELSDYFNALLKNIALETPLSIGFLGAGPLMKAVASKHVTGLNSKLKSVSTRLDKITEPIGKTKAARKAKQYLTSRRGTDDATLAKVIEREASVNTAMKLAQGYADDLKQSIESNLKKQIQANPNYVEEIVDQALKGDDAAMTRLRFDSPQTASIVSEMNNAVQGLQKELSSTTGISSKLSTTIDNSLGTYMTRSYNIFDNPTYKKDIQQRVQKRMGGLDVDGKIGDEVVDRAAEYIANKAGVAMDDSYVQETLEKLVGVGAQDKNAFLGFIEDIANKEVLKNTGKPLFKRKDVPLEIRDLFGEIKDPAKNFAKTYEKLATINAENKFLQEMAVSLETKFQNRVADIMKADPNLTKVQAEIRAKESMVDVSDIGSDALSAIVGHRPLSKGAIKNPLQNVYADEEYAKIMRDGLNPTFNNDSLGGKLLNYAIAAKGLSQKSKTVYNPATHAKNIAGNVTMLGANGMLPAGESVGKAMESVLGNISNKSNRELSKKLALYNRLGITNSNLGLGEIRANMKTVAKNADDFLEKTTTGKRIIGKGKKFDEKVTGIYQAEDDFFKIVHFEKTLDYLKKAYPNLESEELLQMAAQRTRDLMPNYNLVPTAVKSLRVLPVGDFVSFPAEMTRISKNLAKYTLQDLGSGNEELFRAGTKRLGGMTLVGSVPALAMEGSKLLYDIDDEQHDAMAMLGPRYEVNSDKIYLSGINKDKNGHYGVDYVNIGAWDPFNYIKSFAKNTHDIIMMGTGMDKDATNYELNKTALALMDQTVAPFLGPSMLTEAALDAFGLGKGDIRSEPTLEGKLASTMDIVLDTFDPFIGKFLERRKQYEASGMTDYYSTIPASSVDWPAIVGLKSQRADLTAGMRFNFNPEFNQVFSGQDQMQDVLGTPNVTDPEKYMDEFKDAQRVRLKGFRNVKDMVELYRKLGFNLEDMVMGVSLDERFPVNQNKIEILEGASNNYFIPYMPKETNATYLNQAQIPWDRMLKGYSMLEGKRLD